MKVYIVRVYREKLANDQEFVGVVEEVGVRGKSAFTTFEGLCEILNPAAEKDAGKSVSEDDPVEIADDILL